MGSVLPQNRAMRSLLALAIVLFAASPAMANETPEAVYLRFHRAALEADVRTMLRHSTEAQQARMKIDQNHEEQVVKLQGLLPTSYAITGRAAGSTRVVLNMQGRGGGLAGDGGTAAGKVTLLKEGEVWKVDRIEWLPHGPSTPQFTSRPMESSPAAEPTTVQPRGQPSAARAPGSAAAPAAAAPRRPSSGAPPPPPPPSGRGFNPATQRPPGMGEPPPR